MYSLPMQTLLQARREIVTLKQRVTNLESKLVVQTNNQFKDDKFKQELYNEVFNSPPLYREKRYSVKV